RQAAPAAERPGSTRASSSARHDAGAPHAGRRISGDQGPDPGHRPAGAQPLQPVPARRQGSVAGSVFGAEPPPPHYATATPPSTSPISVKVTVQYAPWMSM